MGRDWLVVRDTLVLAVLPLRRPPSGWLGDERHAALVHRTVAAGWNPGVADRCPRLKDDEVGACVGRVWGWSGQSV